MEGKEFKDATPHKNMLWPFKKVKTQKNFSLIVGLTGILLVATTFNSNPAPKFVIGDVSVSYLLIGFGMFILGLFYILEAVSD